MLDVDDSRYPEKYQPVIRRLMKAAAEARVRNVMEIEDDFLSEAEQNERDILEVKQELEEKNKALKEKGKALEESKKTLEEKDKALGEKDKALEEKDRLINELKKKFGVK
jgi:DNA repair exonuclease SbcCD ATPase subunit